MNSYFKKIMSVVAFCFFAGQFLQAQEAKFGFRIGGVMSRQEYKSESILIEPESKFGLDLAVTSDFPLGEVVSFGPELHWMQKGFKANDFDIYDENGNQFTINEATATLNYLELPLLFKFNFGGEDVRLFVMAGPSVGYLLSGKYDFDGVENDDLEFVNRLDVGAQLGAGVHLGPVILDVRYMLGLSNFADDDPRVEEIKNTGFGLGLGIMF